MSTTEERLAVIVRQNAQPSIRPLFESRLDTAYDEQDWRDSHRLGLEERQEVPQGFIASVGRLGVAIDSSEGGPKIKGLAFSLGRSASVVAGGNLGGGGIGASLSLRLRF